MAIYQTKNPTKDGRSYYFRIKYRDILGNIHDYSSPKFLTRKEAVNEEARYRLRINENETFLNNLSLGQVFEKFMQKKELEIKRQTITKFNNLYKQLILLKDVKINNLKYTHIDLLKKELDKKNYSIEYKNKIIRLLESLIKFSNKYYNTSLEILKFCDHYKSINEIKKEMQFFTFEEYKQFDSIIDDFDFHVFFEVLYYMGLRQGELQALTFKDINFEKAELKINKTLTTKIKGEKWTISSPKTKSSTRTLPIPNNILNDLKTMFNNAKKYKDFKIDWFVFGNSQPFKETTIQVKKNNYCELAKVKQIRIHDFRHSCASLLINKGATIALVSKYLGHSDISITLKTYTHMYKSELENIKNVLNDL